MFNFNEPSFWVSAAFVILVALLYKKVSHFMGVFLDSHAKKVKTELDAASRIRAEAEEVLASYKKKQAEFAKEAETILTKAKEDAKLNRARAEAELKSALDARLKNAMEKIAQEEAKAIAEVRNNIVEITIESAKNIIAKQMGDISADETINLTISDIEHKIH